jgi:energy-coupling factor transporter ATP-binding protein EcfA2
MSTENLQYRYPGTRPFTEDESSLFFGRNSDIEKLVRKIKLEQLLVLFGKSGLGKSSLINAGVLPELKAENNYLPVKIRFGYADAEKNPVSVFLDSIPQTKNKKLAKIIENKKDLFFDESFWIACKNLQLQNKDKTILLVFDQFEELFLFEEAQTNQFSKLLSVLLFGEMPQKLQDKIYEQLDEDENYFNQKELDAFFEKIDIKVVFSIRSDKMSLLNRLRTNIPQILKKTYELEALNTEQAEEAMLKPANAEGEFVSRKFNYENETRDKIINYLSKNRKKQIETFQLQLICQYCEKIVIDKNEDDIKITPDKLGELSTIFSRHYDNLINEIPEEQRLSIRILIEENMIIDGNRVPLPDKVIISRHKISKELLQKLVNSRLLRSEPNTTDGYSYEISHDTLIEPINTAYKIRREKEEEQKAILEQQEKQRIAHEKAEKERIEREKERKRQRTIIAVASIAAIVSIAFAIFGYVKMKEAQVEKEKAETQTEIAIKAGLRSDSLNNEAQAALKKFIKEENERKKAEINSLLQKANSYMSFGEKKLAIKALKNALKIDSTHTEVKKQLQKLEN